MCAFEPHFPSAPSYCASVHTSRMVWTVRLELLLEKITPEGAFRGALVRIQSTGPDYTKYAIKSLKHIWYILQVLSTNCFTSHTYYCIALLVNIHIVSHFWNEDLDHTNPETREVLQCECVRSFKKKYLHVNSSELLVQLILLLIKDLKSSEMEIQLKREKTTGSNDRPAWS